MGHPVEEVDGSSAIRGARGRHDQDGKEGGDNGVWIIARVCGCSSGLWISCKFSLFLALFTQILW